MNGPDEIFESEKERAEFAPLERELARALQPVEAPDGFAERVMRRAEAGKRPFVVADRQAARGKVLMMSHPWRAWATGAMAAALVLGALQSERVHQQHERQAQAQRQFEAAEQITDRALSQVREQVQRAISLNE